MSVYLQRRLDELNHEIRTYPGPIARCDEHLPALIDERSKIVAQLEHESCPSEARWGHDGGRNI